MKPYKKLNAAKERTLTKRGDGCWLCMGKPRISCARSKEKEIIDQELIDEEITEAEEWEDIWYVDPEEDEDWFWFQLSVIEEEVDKELKEEEQND